MDVVVPRMDAMTWRTGLQYAGNDANGKPKSDYLVRISKMNGGVLSREIERQVLKSAMYVANPQNDSHWRHSALKDECIRRMRWDIFHSAARRARKTLSSIKKAAQ